MSDSLAHKPNHPNKPFKRSFGATLLAVAWSFIGLRSRKEFDRDVTAFNPVYVIAAGFIGVIVLIATLLMVVRIVVG